MPADSARGVVLVVEDERAISDLLRLYISREGFGVHVASDGRSALTAARTMHPIAIVLDVGLPEMDGTEVCRQLRAEGNWVPILFCTARDDEVDRVLGLELGADDYITKPFSPRVLSARVKVLLRRREAGRLGDQEETLEIHELVIHPGRHEVTLAGRPVELTYTEFALLHFLARRPGWAFTRTQIVDAVKGEDYPVTERSVDVQVAGLRKKLGDHAWYVETVRGVGYRFRG